MSAPLDGIRVLDLSRVRSGPTCVRQLADWGADVVMVEPPVSVDPGEGMGGPRHGPDFQNLHRNKRSITLDLKAAEGIALLHTLVQSADIVVENFRPRVKQRLRLDYPSLAAINPRIILASISGFGEDGPYADRPGLDQVAQGIGGLMSITGHPGQGPMRVGIPIADLCAGLFAAQGVLLALIARERTGRGQWVRTSLLEAQVAMLDFQAARWLVARDVPGQAGNDHPTAAPMGVFRTSDGHINIAAIGPDLWRRLCGALGIEGLFDDPIYASDDLRRQNRASLNRAIEERTSGMPSAWWIARLNEAGVPCGPINAIDAVFADPQVRHLGIARELDHPDLGPIALVGQPIALSEVDRHPVRPAPGRGEHNAEVLGSIGIDAQTLALLMQRGIV